LYLPLDKLIQSTNPGAAPSSGASSSTRSTDQSQKSDNAESEAEDLRSGDMQLDRNMRDRP
jgi:hypothetical protein